MLFGLFQANAAPAEDDIATGTYADGAPVTPSGEASIRPRDRSQTFRRAHAERDYAAARSASQMGAGFVA